MATKKYNQFDLGSYDSSKIILIADPTTGELKKIPLSAIPAQSSSNRLYTFLDTITSTGNNGFLMFNLLIYNSYFSNPGDTIHFRFWGQYVWGPNFCNLTFSMGTINFSFQQQSTNWNTTYDIFVMRTSETTWKFAYVSVTDGNPSAQFNSDNITFTPSSSYAALLIKNGTEPNQFTLRGGFVQVLKS